MCIAQYKIHNTSENFYFEVILNRTIISCKVTNVTNRYMDFILDLDEEFDFQRPVCLDSNRMHPGGCTNINQKVVDNMFVPGAAIQKWNFPLFLVTNVTLEWAKSEIIAHTHTHTHTHPRTKATTTKTTSTNLHSFLYLKCQSHNIYFYTTVSNVAYRKSILICRY